MSSAVRDASRELGAGRHQPPRSQERFQREEDVGVAS